MDHAVPRKRTKKRHVGLGRGKVEIPASFFKPLPRDVLDAFEGAER